ncbi:TolC family protein, partial [Candidatus Omnitrophota bacterium]
DKEVMAGTSQIKEARVNREKAENDLLEARRQISLETKEAYYNYQESIIQVKNTLEKVKFNEEAVKVAKAQSELNEALQSQLLEAMVKLADEKSLYIKALSDYNLSIYKLNKAIGIRDHFSLE